MPYHIRKTLRSMVSGKRGVEHHKPLVPGKIAQKRIKNINTRHKIMVFNNEKKSLENLLSYIFKGVVSYSRKLPKISEFLLFSQYIDI